MFVTRNSHYRMMLFAVSIFVTMACSIEALGFPAAVEAYCKKYPKAKACVAAERDCNVCHAGPPSLNAYGKDLQTALNGEGSAVSEDVVIAALGAIESKDSDGDGFSNKMEIEAESRPGDKAVTPEAASNLVYDETIALRRLLAVYCGKSLMYKDAKELKAAPDKKAYLHKRLDACLATDYWTKEGVARIADQRIRPLSAVSTFGAVVIGDYRYDYWLWNYVMTGDRDARELLSAQYHIGADGKKIEGLIDREESPTINGRIVIAGGEPLQVDRRAGMMTTQWFFATNSMFAELPRNSASAIFRYYLGLDLAKGEGLQPIAGEPRDVDSRNVKQEACAVCHSTLDPLSYAFSAYVGIETVTAFFINSNGTYRGSVRTSWEADSTILGKKVANLLEWADVARNSDYFKKKLAKDMFNNALRRDPFSSEAADFETLWKSLPADGYSVNKMLHRLLDTIAFGGKVQ